MKIVQHNNENTDAVCPIPLKQQPVREYWRLREKKFFRWAILNRNKYITKLLAVWVSALLLALFFVVLRSPYRPLSSADLLMGAIIAELAVWLVLIRLYSAWQYIYSRLIHREINYINLATNETKLWSKAELVLARDLLIARFQVRPILRRIAGSMFLLAVIISTNFLILSVTSNY